MRRGPDLAALGEFGLIERLARRLAAAGAAPAAGAITLGPGDDAALLSPPAGAEIAATIDSLVEDVHFRREWSSPADLGWKALAVNVSDLAAMGARPLGALVTLAVPPGTAVGWIDRLYGGLAECAVSCSCPVVGGDTVRSPDRVVLSVAALGAVPPGAAVLRSGARAGDLLCVTGVLGDSAAGLALLQRGNPRGGTARELLRRHLRPRPPIEAAAALAETGLATAMLDLSDGLASDLRHLASRSGVGARVEAERLPISDAARRIAAELGADADAWALRGGEDYELLFTTPPDRFPRVPALLAAHGAAATIVGRVVRRGLTLAGRDGSVKPLRPDGFAHFPRAAG